VAQKQIPISALEKPKRLYPSTLLIPSIVNNFKFKNKYIPLFRQNIAGGGTNPSVDCCFTA